MEQLGQGSTSKVSYRMGSQDQAASGRWARKTGEEAGIRTWKLGVEELCASAVAMLPARSDSDVERCPPSFCFSLSLERFLADLELPAISPI